MNLPQFITVNATIEGFKTKCLLRIDRIHCISEVMLGEPTKVIIHYNLPNSSELETLVVDETMQDLIGCSPTSLQVFLILAVGFHSLRKVVSLLTVS